MITVVLMIKRVDNFSIDALNVVYIVRIVIYGGGSKIIIYAKGKGQLLSR